MYARCSRAVYKKENLTEQSTGLNEGECLRHVIADHHTMYWKDTSERTGRMLALFSIY